MDLSPSGRRHARTGDAGTFANRAFPSQYRARRLDHRLAHVLWSAHAAEAEVDGWLDGVEERLQLQGQLPLVRSNPGARLHDIQVRGLSPWRQRRVGGRPWPVREDVAPHVRDRCQTGCHPVGVGSCGPVVVPAFRVLNPESAIVSRAVRWRLCPRRQWGGAWCGDGRVIGHQAA